MLKQAFEAHASRLPAFTAREAELYDAYFALLREWNEKINLVSRKSIETSFAYHFADSLFIADFANRHRETRPYADLGTGAGFPGIVFAIRYPEVPVTLFEKLQKRRIYLEAVIQALGLKNVRLEAALPDKRYGDIFTARAVFPPPELFPFMKKHLKNGGRFVLSVGGSTEIPETPKSFKLLGTESYELPEGAGTRKVASFELCST